MNLEKHKLPIITEKLQCIKKNLEGKNLTILKPTDDTTGRSTSIPHSLPLRSC